MITGIVVVFFLAILALDLRPLWKNMNIKIRIVYCSLLLVSFCVLVLYTINIPIPSPAIPIIKLIDALFPGLGK